MSSGPSPAVTAARCGGLSVVRTSRWGAVSATGKGVEATVESHLTCRLRSERDARRDVGSPCGTGAGTPAPGDRLVHQCLDRDGGRPAIQLLLPPDLG